MNGTLLLCICLAYFVVGYFTYGGYIRRLFNINPDRQTPAHTNFDGVDYEPCNTVVLFGHHFSSIAGAGPIVGPIVASYFGWLPALLWILIGCVFIGAVHDFAALFLSVRNQGKSIGFIIEKILGFKGRQLFLMFSLCALILVVTIFALMVVGTFIATPAVATSSVIFILIAPIFGFISRTFLSLRTASVIFVPIILAVIYFSTIYVVDVKELLSLDDTGIKYFWLAVIGIYILLASVFPVHWLLQPRDYLSSYILYAMLVIGFVGVFVYQPEIKLTAFKGFTVTGASGTEDFMFPSLFILIACGACSGFHSLVASGTTAKQITSEKSIQVIGYGSMIMEGIIGVLGIIAVAYLSDADFATIGKNPVHAFASGLGVFAESFGLPKEVGSVFISLAISAFMLTSLDTATRLARFLWQELFSSSYLKTKELNDKSHHEVQLADASVLSQLKKLITNNWVASLIIVTISIGFALSGQATSIWPIFGSANQLLSAITLLTVTIYLIIKKKNFWITLLPTMLMIVMSVWGIVNVFTGSLGKNNSLVISSAILLALSLVLIVLAIIVTTRYAKGLVQVDDLD